MYIMASKMEIYLGHLSKRADIVSILKYFSQGCGVQLGEILPVFSISPDPHIFEDFPELEGLDSVGFYNDYDPPPQLVSFSEFYERLKEAVEKNPCYTDSNTQKEMLYYLYKLRDNYGITK